MLLLLFQPKMAASVAAGPSSSPAGGDLSSPGPGPPHPHPLHPQRQQQQQQQQGFYLGRSDRSDSHSPLIGGEGGRGDDRDRDLSDDEEEEGGAGPIYATARAESGSDSADATATSVGKSGMDLTFANWGLFSKLDCNLQCGITQPIIRIFWHICNIKMHSVHDVSRMIHDRYSCRSRN